MAFFESMLTLLLVAIVFLQFSRKFRIPYPTMLAIAGIIVAAVPWAPEVAIDPQLALALLIAPVRQWCGRMARRWIQSWAGGHTRQDPSVIDLDPDEWKQVRERKLPYRPKKPKSH